MYRIHDEQTAIYTSYLLLKMFYSTLVYGILPMNGQDD